MGMRIAALIRHGDYHQQADTPSAHQPHPLNATGRQQAAAAADWIKQWLAQQPGELVSEFDSSSLLRAWQTADIVRQHLADTSCSVNIFDALAERSVGSLANLSLPQIEKVIEADPRFAPLPENWKSDSHFCLPTQGAESLLDAGKRVAQHIRQQMHLLPNKTTPQLKLFFGHGAAFRHAAYHLGVLPFERIKQLSMYHAKPVLLAHEGNEHWQHIGGNWKERTKATSFTD